MSAAKRISPGDETVIREHDGVAHIATAVDDAPHVAPVFYRYEDRRVYFITDGKKLANLRENPRVSVGLYEETGPHPEEVRQATILGTATIVDDWGQTKEYGDAIRRKYYGEPSDKWPTRDDTLVRVDIGSVSAVER